MDTSSGEIYLNDEEVKKALKNGAIRNADDLVELPIELARELVNKNRTERRQWWAQNRKKLNLPRWNNRTY